MGCKVSIQVHPLPPPSNNPQDPQVPQVPPDKDPEEPKTPDEWVDIYGPDYKTEIEV